MESKVDTLPSGIEKHMIVLTKDEKLPTLEVEGYPKYSYMYPLSNNPLTIYIDTPEPINVIDLELEFDSNMIQSTGKCSSGKDFDLNFTCTTNDPLNKIHITGVGLKNKAIGKLEVALAEFKWIEKTQFKSIVPIKVKILGLSYGESALKPNTIKISRDVKKNSYYEYESKRYTGGEFFLDKQGKINYTNNKDAKMEVIKSSKPVQETKTGVEKVVEKRKLLAENNSDMEISAPIIYTTPNELKDNWADGAQLHRYCNRKKRRDKQLQEGKYCKLRCPNRKYGGRIKFKDGQFDVSQYSNFEEYCNPKEEKQSDMEISAPIIYTTPNELKHNWADSARINRYCNRKKRRDKQLREGQYCKLRCPNRKWGGPLKFKNGQFDVSQYSNFEEYCN
jgi:hypothetical protein